MRRLLNRLNLTSKTPVQTLRSTKPSNDKMDQKAISEMLKKVWQPILVSNRLCGLAFSNNRNKIHDIDLIESQVPDRKKKSWCSFGRIYCLVVITIQWLQFCRQMTTFEAVESLGADLFLKIAGALWIFQCTMEAVVVYRASCRDFMSMFLAQLADVIHELTSLDYSNRLRKRYIIVTAIAWSMAILTLFCLSYVVLFAHYFDALFAPISHDWSGLVYIKAVSLFIWSWTGAYWIFPLLSCYCIMSSLSVCFEQFNKDFKKSLHDANKENVDFEKYRLLHSKIVSLVRSADEMLSPLIGLVLGLNICLLCLQSYNLLTMLSGSEEIDVVLVLIIVFWMSYSAFQILFLSASAAMVNCTAHGGLDDLHEVHSKYITLEKNIEVVMLLNRLSGNPIGLTAAGLFVVDKPTILTIVGVFLSYLVVLLQFQPISSTTAAICLRNCTI